MLRRCRGIRGDVGIAPYERSIEGAAVKRREGQSPSPTGRYKGCVRATGGGVWSPRPTEGYKGVRSWDGGAMHPKGACFAASAGPPLHKGGLMPRRCRGIRGDVGIAPYERTRGAMVKWTAGGIPQGCLFRFAPLRGHRPLRKVYRGWVRLIYKRKRRVGASFCIFFLPFTFVWIG